MFEQWTTVEILVPNYAVDSVASFLSDNGSRGCLTEDIDTDLAKVTAYFTKLPRGICLKRGLKDYWSS